MIKNQLKRSLFIIAISLSLANLTSCGNEPAQNSAPVETPLSASGDEQPTMFNSTGEVVVFFRVEPELRGEKPMASEQELADFNLAIKEVQAQLKELKIESYITTKPDVKFTISDKSKFVMNANSSPKGIGFIMSKNAHSPEIYSEGLSSQEMISKIKTFYNK